MAESRLTQAHCSGLTRTNVFSLANALRRTPFDEFKANLSPIINVIEASVAGHAPPFRVILPLRMESCPCCATHLLGRACPALSGMLRHFRAFSVIGQRRIRRRQPGQNCINAARPQVPPPAASPRLQREPFASVAITTCQPAARASFSTALAKPRSALIMTIAPTSAFPSEAERRIGNKRRRVRKSRSRAHGLMTAGA